MTLAAKLLEHCGDSSQLSDVAAICREVIEGSATEDEPLQSSDRVRGYVYLLKSGRYYKIGKSKSPDRRRSEVALLLPDDATTVHVIATDDPDGIEAYWHNRFKDKRHRGEFFRLDAEDVRAFKRRREYM